MKRFLTILTLLSATTSFSQVDEIRYFYNLKPDTDSALNYFLSFLRKSDHQELNQHVLAEKAAEKVGDYYRSRQDYHKAAAYYDSADAKYRDPFQFCGNGYYIDFIPRRYKVSQCYAALGDFKKSVSSLTPHIFDRLGFEYFDSLMISFYVETVHRLYSPEEARVQLQKAIDNIEYSTEIRPTKDSSESYLKVNCKFSLFDTSIDLAGYSISMKNGKIPFSFTKEAFVQRIKRMEVYRRLSE